LQRRASQIFPSAHSDFFECTAEEGEKAFLHRFGAASAAVRYRAVQSREVEDIVALDLALKRNDQGWFEKSDTPRVAGGLVSGAASKAVVPSFNPSR